jgi:ribosomal protein L11
MGLIQKIFGTYSQRELKSIYPIADKIEALEDEYRQLTDEQLTKIAEIKMPDLNANDIEAAKKIVAGTARSMGVTIAE